MTIEQIVSEAIAQGYITSDKYDQIMSSGDLAMQREINNQIDKQNVALR